MGLCPQRPREVLQICGYPFPVWQIRGYPFSAWQICGYPFLVGKSVGTPFQSGKSVAIPFESANPWLPHLEAQICRYPFSHPEICTHPFYDLRLPPTPSHGKWYRHAQCVIVMSKTRTRRRIDMNAMLVSFLLQLVSFSLFLVSFSGLFRCSLIPGGVYPLANRHDVIRRICDGSDNLSGTHVPRASLSFSLIYCSAWPRRGASPLH